MKHEFRRVSLHRQHHLQHDSSRPSFLASIIHLALSPSKQASIIQPSFDSQPHSQENSMCTSRYSAAQQHPKPPRYKLDVIEPEQRDRQ
jgi:hypothetical protein